MKGMTTPPGASVALQHDCGQYLEGVPEVAAPTGRESPGCVASRRLPGLLTLSIVCQRPWRGTGHPRCPGQYLVEVRAVG